jgi:ribonuclease BN (tRNA processing enzyme)
VVLLGTAGGPPQLDGARYGVSTAVAFEDRYYVVDLGLGSFVRLAQSSLRGESDLGSSLAQARAILFTHMHSDHLADWPAVYAMGGMNKVGRALGAIDVFGPGDRGTLPRLFPPNRPEPALYNPEEPTPGITGMTRHLRNAWAADFNDRARDTNFPTPDDLFTLHDIDLSSTWQIDPEGRPPVLAEPLHVLDRHTRRPPPHGSGPGVSLRHP